MTQIEEVGTIRLVTMGLATATNLLKAGFSVRGYDPVAGATAALTDVGDAAYDALSDTMKAVLDPLVAMHTGDVYRNRYEAIGGGLRRDDFPYVEHPVIRTHPLTGRKGIYVNRPFTQKIRG